MTYTSSYFGLLNNNLKINVNSLHLIFSIFISITFFLYVDRTIRIKRIASYIHSYLRQALILKLGGVHVWHWEIYKKITAQAKEATFIISLLLDKLRASIFIVPIVFSNYIFFNENTKFEAITVLLLIINFVFVSAVILLMFSFEETKGADHDLASFVREIDKLSDSEIKRYKDE